MLRENSLDTISTYMQSEFVGSGTDEGCLATIRPDVYGYRDSASSWKNAADTAFRVDDEMGRWKDNVNRTADDAMEWINIGFDSMDNYISMARAFADATFHMDPCNIDKDKIKQGITIDISGKLEVLVTAIETVVVYIQGLLKRLAAEIASISFGAIQAVITAELAMISAFINSIINTAKNIGRVFKSTMESYKEVYEEKKEERNKKKEGKENTDNKKEDKNEGDNKEEDDEDKKKKRTCFSELVETVETASAEQHSNFSNLVSGSRSLANLQLSAFQKKAYILQEIRTAKNVIKNLKVLWQEFLDAPLLELSVAGAKFTFDPEHMTKFAAEYKSARFDTNTGFSHGNRKL